MQALRILTIFREQFPSEILTMTQDSKHNLLVLVIPQSFNLSHVFKTMNFQKKLQIAKV